MTFNTKDFLKERKSALLSMDKETIQSFFEKYNGSRIPDHIFDMTIHKARTGDKTLPMFERAASKWWLIKHGMDSMDDGDVLPPEKGSDLKKYFDRLDEWGVD